jgi:hypothetical protein
MPDRGHHEDSMKFLLPEHGAIRVRRRFAFLPVIIEDHKVWLEFYYEHEIYERFFGDHEGHWRKVILRGADA